MNFTNITFTGIPEQKINMDYTWDEIINYYYYLFLYFFSSTSYIYLVLWIQNRLIQRDLSYSDSDSETEENIQNEKAKIPYENEMFDEYDNLEDKELTENYVKDLALNTITETTPRGDVLMYYDVDLESFVYYSKTKEIPYKYLETVARKYVINYDCKNIYVDIRKEYENGVNKCKIIKEKEKATAEKTGTDAEPTGENKKKQLFVKLKSYNRKAEVNSKQKDKIYILREHSNRYSYRGKIEEYKEPVTSESENTTATDDTDPSIDKKTIDFSTFKKIKSI